MHNILILWINHTLLMTKYITILNAHYIYSKMVKQLNTTLSIFYAKQFKNRWFRTQKYKINKSLGNKNNMHIINILNQTHKYKIKS